MLLTANVQNYEHAKKSKIWSQTLQIIMCFDFNRTWSEVKLHNFGVKVRVKLGV